MHTLACDYVHAWAAYAHLEAKEGGQEVLLEQLAECGKGNVDLVQAVFICEHMCVSV